jgi:hypothetical protein
MKRFVPTSLIAAAAILAVSAVPASAGIPTKVLVPKRQACVQTINYRYGLNIKPGANTIVIDGHAMDKLRPKVSGWIVGFRPGLERPDGTSPPVSEIHLHHAVWLVNFQPTYAAGEEKTRFDLPNGFGYRYKPSDNWILNHMIHNLTPTPTKVYLTWQLQFIPDSSPCAKGITEARTQWLDVEGGKAYPVFNVPFHGGTKNRWTFPDDVPTAYAADATPRNQWTADRDATLIGTAGHLHPGGLYTDLKLTRDGKTVTLFRSHAKYYEKAGAVSWDVSMEATPPKWRIAIKKGDVLSVHGTYDTSRAAWYESMAIMPVATTLTPQGGLNPFTDKIPKQGYLTHGQLPENSDAQAGKSNPAYQDTRKLKNGPSVAKVIVKNFTYEQGDLTLRGKAGLPPVVQQGASLEFFNGDAKSDVMHSITGCAQPCGLTSGISFPLANGVQFDSGNLGFGPALFTATANRDTWDTPPTLKPGTYTYFCRIHPFMRGAFRVIKAT